MIVCHMNIMRLQIPVNSILNHTHIISNTLMMKNQVYNKRL